MFGPIAFFITWWRWPQQLVNIINTDQWSTMNKSKHKHKHTHTHTHTHGEEQTNNHNTDEQRNKRLNHTVTGGPQQVSKQKSKKWSPEERWDGTQGYANDKITWTVVRPRVEHLLLLRELFLLLKNGEVTMDDVDGIPRNKIQNVCREDIQLKNASLLDRRRRRRWWGRWEHHATTTATTHSLARLADWRRKISPVVRTVSLWLMMYSSKPVKRRMNYFCDNPHQNFDDVVSGDHDYD